MISAIFRIDESRVEVQLIDLVKFRLEALGWHFRYPQVRYLQPINDKDGKARRRRSAHPKFFIKEVVERFLNY